MDENWIPVIGMICVFGLPIGGWITVRVLAHRERMAMLQRGIMPPPDPGFFRRNAAWTPPPQWNPAPPPPPYAYDDPNSPQCMLRKGITTAAVGVALFIGLSFIGYRGGDGFMQSPTFHPGPWLLGGLIPMFVGFAQIAIAVLSGASFALPRGQMPPVGPPPVDGPFPSYAPPPEPGRPGARFEELARPVPPPDRR